MAGKKSKKKLQSAAKSSAAYYFVEFVRVDSTVDLHLLARLKAAENGTSFVVDASLGYHPITAQIPIPGRLDPSLKNQLGYAKLEDKSGRTTFCTSPDSKRIFVGRLGSWLLKHANLDEPPASVILPPGAELYFCNDHHFQGPYITVQQDGLSSGVVPAERKNLVVWRFRWSALPHQVVPAGLNRWASPLTVDPQEGTPIDIASPSQRASFVGRLLASEVGQLALEPTLAGVLWAMLDHHFGVNYTQKKLREYVDSHADGVGQIKAARLKLFEAAANKTNLHEILSKVFSGFLSASTHRREAELTEIEHKLALLSASLVNSERENAEKIAELDREVARKQESLAALEQKSGRFLQSIRDSRHELIQEFAGYSILFDELAKQRSDRSSPAQAPPHRPKVDEQFWFEQSLVPFCRSYLGSESDQIPLAIHLALCSTPFTLFANPLYARCYVDSLGQAARLAYVHCSQAWVDWSDAWRLGFRRPWRFAMQNPGVHTVLALVAPETTCSSLWLTPLVDLASGMADEIAHVRAWPSNLRLVILPGPDGENGKLPRGLGPETSAIPVLGSPQARFGVEPLEPDLMWPQLSKDRVSIVEPRESRMASKLKALGREAAFEKIARKIFHEWPDALLGPLLKD